MVGFLLARTRLLISQSWPPAFRLPMEECAHFLTGAGRPSHTAVKRAGRRPLAVAESRGGNESGQAEADIGASEDVGYIPRRRGISCSADTMVDRRLPVGGSKTTAPQHAPASLRTRDASIHPFAPCSVAASLDTSTEGGLPNERAAPYDSGPGADASRGDRGDRDRHHGRGGGAGRCDGASGQGPVGRTATGQRLSRSPGAMPWPRVRTSFRGVAVQHLRMTVHGSSSGSLLDFTSAALDVQGCPLYTFAANPTGSPGNNTGANTFNYVTRQTSNCFSTGATAGAARAAARVRTGTTGTGAAAARSAARADGAVRCRPVA